MYRKLIVFFIIFLIKISSTKTSLNSIEFDDENQNQLKYVKWIVNELSLLSKVKNFTCVTVANLNNDFFEGDFKSLLLEELSSQSVFQVIHQNVFLIEYKNRLSCDEIEILIDTNFKTIFTNVEKFSNLSKSKFFIVLFPWAKLNTTTKFNPLNWPTNSFKHVDVIVVINFMIFRLQSPYQKKDRIFELKESFYESRNVLVNFGGKHLRVSALDCRPFNYWTKSNESFIESGSVQLICDYGNKNQTNCKKSEGIESKLLSTLSEKLNFSWSLVSPLNGSYGLPLSDGTEDGIVGEVLTGRADLCFCGLWVQYPRNTLLHFTSSWLDTCLTFLVPRPRVLPHTWYSAFMGFKTSLWICLLGVVILMVLLIIIFTKFAKSSMNIKNDLSPTEIIMDVLNIIFTSTSLPDYAIPGTVSLLTGWAFFCLFISQLYSTDLITFLTIPRHEKRIDSTTDFVRNNLTWGLFRPTSFEYLNMNLKADRSIKQMFRLENDINTRLEGISSSKYGVMVYNFHGSAVVFEGFDEIPVTNLRLMKSCLFRPYIAFGFAQNSPFNDVIDQHLGRLFEAGVANYIKAKEIGDHQETIWESISNEKDFKAQSQEKGPEILTLEQLYGPFFVLMTGCSVGLFIFLLEFLYYYLNSLEDFDF